jgi:hypothetical protein
MLWGSISLAVVSISRPRNLVGYSKNYILEKDLHPSFIIYLVLQSIGKKA